MKSVRELECQGKAVFYRPDYNVPLKDGEIQDDFRITATFPTLDVLIEKGAKIIIGAHLGRPDSPENPAFDLRPVAERLADQYPQNAVFYAHAIDDPEVSKSIETMQPGDMLLLPNLRYNEGEEKNSPEYAKQLAGLAEFYVNDAFACDHRAHASIVGIPALIPGYAGLLLEEEVSRLGSLLDKPEHPFVVVMGGAKVSDKIEVIKRLAEKADTILVGGAMANTFLLAKGEKIGDSLAEADKVDVAKELIKSLGEKLVLATDFVKDNEADAEHFKYLDIGEQSVEEFAHKLKDAKLIFWNGSLGYTEDDKYAVASKDIAEFIGGLKSTTSIVAGGDTVEMISRLGLHDKFSFVSTGGGAALEFLAGEKLPGVVALEK